VSSIARKFSVSTPQVSDLRNLARVAAATEWHGPTLDTIVGVIRTLSQPTYLSSPSCFSRLVALEGEIGHVSASLISLGQQRALLKRSRSRQHCLDWGVISPLDSDSLQEKNAGEGSALVITSLIWSNHNAQNRESVLVLGECFERLARWFEGNTINSILIPVTQPIYQMIEPIVSAHAEQGLAKYILNSDDLLVHISKPWTPKAISTDWTCRLLEAYPEPSINLWSNRARQNARVFHECRYRVEESVESRSSTWKTVGAYNSWRREFSTRFMLNPRRSKGIDVYATIADILACNPRVMAP